MFHTDRDMNNNVCQHFLPKTKFRANSTNPDKKQKAVLSNKTFALMAAGKLFGVNYKVLGTSKNFQKNTFLLNLVKIRLTMESPTAKLMCMRHLLPNCVLLYDFKSDSAWAQS